MIYFRCCLCGTKFSLVIIERGRDVVGNKLYELYQASLFLLREDHLGPLTQMVVDIYNLNYLPITTKDSDCRTSPQHFSKLTIDLYSLLCSSSLHKHLCKFSSVQTQTRYSLVKVCLACFRSPWDLSHHRGNINLVPPFLSLPENIENKSNIFFIHVFVYFQLDSLCYSHYFHFTQHN